MRPQIRLPIQQPTLGHDTDHHWISDWTRVRSAFVIGRRKSCTGKPVLGIVADFMIVVAIMIVVGVFVTG